MTDAGDRDPEDGVTDEATEREATGEVRADAGGVGDGGREGGALPAAAAPRTTPRPRTTKAKAKTTPNARAVANSGAATNGGAATSGGAATTGRAATARKVTKRTATGRGAGATTGPRASAGRAADDLPGYGTTDPLADQEAAAELEAAAAERRARDAAVDARSDDAPNDDAANDDAAPDGDQDVDATPGRSIAPAAVVPAGPTASTTPKKRAPRTPRRPPAAQQPVVLSATGLVKRYGQKIAADGVDLEIRQGSIFGVVGPNGAGKTTTLSMITGLLRPDAGSVTVLDHDVWSDPARAKRSMGVLPDRLRLFDRLTGAQLLHYSATLRGLDGPTARSRSADLARAFDLGDAVGRQVADYSVGMAKKIALAATMIHSPRVLVLDEPFESVDPVSAVTITDILRRYAAGGGTVILSSHSMELVQRTCDSVAIIVAGRVLAAGTMTQVRGRKSLEDKFVELAGGRVVAEGLEWLHSFSG